MKFLKREDAVSPVIGVILMVAITVILAAVIAAFVFGMASGVSKTKAVAATARQMGASTFVITYQGGQDDPLVSGLNVTLLDNGSQYCFTATGLGTASCVKPVVGQAASAGTATAGQDHVVVTAAFTDGSSQVILDTYV
jgi:flagellin-like protein